jgi:hypothetical protein
LLGRLDISSKEDGAAEIEIARQGAPFDRNRRALEAADQQLTDIAAGG